MPTIQELYDLTGRAAIVTGGAGLLGRQFCKTLAEAGAAVTVADIDLAAAEKIAADLAESGFRVQAVQVDVTSPASVQNMVDATVAAFGQLDILVNSAAMDPKFDPDHAGSHTNAFEDYPLTSWNEAVNVNLTGMFLCCQAAAREMVKKGQGSIINLCSTYGLAAPDQRIYKKEGQPQQYKPVFYSVTKAGVLGLSRYLAAYYAGTAIRTNSLTPGGVFNNHDDEFNKAYSYRTIMGRMAHQHEMSGALLFLASDASSYMTGSNVVVDGGWTAW